MIDLEKYLIPQIADRCKNLRANTTFNMDDIADKAAISRIEKGQNVKSGNFITDTVLWEYSNTFDIPQEEIIFGRENELEECLFDLFVQLFRLISRRNLAIDMSHYKKGAFDDLDIEIQKAVIPLANSFAEYNRQRYNFLKSEKAFMDCVDKDLDQTFFMGGKPVNLERDWRTEPINEETVIDIADMEEKMWLMCKEKFSRSFKSEVIETLFDDFKFTNINAKVSQWIKQQFIKAIVPDIVVKLRSNSIFKIGYMVQNLIDEFLDEDLSESFQSTIPIQTLRPEHFEINFPNDASFTDMSDEIKSKRMGLYKEVMELFQNGKIDKLTDEEIENYATYGIYIREVPEVNLTREVDIDAVIDQAITSKGLDKTVAEPQLTIEQGPIIRVADFNSKEEMMAFYDDWYDSTHFKNMTIPGYFTNNSQIVQRWQERLNKEVRESIETFIVIQNNLLKLLTDDELVKFAK